MSLLAEDYTLPELRDFIRKKLGGSVWRLEGMGKSESDLIDQSISEALHAYSRRCPMPGWEMVQTNSRQGAYSLTNPGYGPWRVDPIEPVPLVAPITFNLLGVTPISNFQGDEIAQFMNWRKTFRRIISSDMVWQWDEDNKKIYIYNVSNFTRVCVYVYRPRSFEKVSLVHKDFLRRFSVAHCKLSLGTIRRKFAEIPGPGGNSIKLDGDTLVKEAEEELKACNEELMLFQPRAPVTFD